MARWLRFILILGLLSPQLAAAGGNPAKLMIAFQGRDRTYYLLVPDTAKPAPLLVLLHGSGGNGLFLLERWKDVATREDIILLAPDSLHPDIGWDLHVDGPDFIRALVDAVATSHPVELRRLYVFGQSGGAVYTLTLAMLESEYFAAAALHAGAWRRPAEYRVMDYARRKIPVAMFVGDKDEYFSVGSAQSTERILTQRGIPAELHLLPGRVHSYLDVPPDFHDTVWSFLKANALGDPVRYAPYRLGPEPLK
jgi:poly(3-hydroxybutyrate) depolymerase